MISLLIFNILFFIQILNAAEFDVMTKSVKCYEVNKEIVSNHSCRVKVTRELPGGILQLKFFFEKLDRVNVFFELYYKYGTIYRPYLITMDLDACELFKKNSPMLENKILQKFIKILDTEFPTLVKGCPYENSLETKLVNLNTSVSSILPPVVPTGFFKAHFRAYLPENNATLVIIDIEINIKARKAFRAMDFSMMQMG